jgi:hypothetical protein
MLNEMQYRQTVKKLLNKSIFAIIVLSTFISCAKDKDAFANIAKSNSAKTTSGVATIENNLIVTDTPYNFNGKGLDTPYVLRSIFDTPYVEKVKAKN